MTAPPIDAIDHGGYAGIRGDTAVVGPLSDRVRRVEGSAARDLVDTAFARDVAFMPRGRARLSLVLDHRADPRDVTLVVRDPTRPQFVIRTDAAAPGLDAWLTQQAQEQSVDASILDESEAVLLLEGPGLPRLLEQLFGSAVASMKYLSACDASLDGAPVLVVRAGQTGEFGVEVIGPLGILDDLRSAAIDLGAIPCTDGALATAKLEVRHPCLSQAVAASDCTVPELGWAWLTTPRKGSFIGSDALLGHLGSRRRQMVLLVSADAIDPATTLDAPWTAAAGEVRLRAWSPSLEAWLHLAAVDVRHAAVGVEYRAGATGAVATSVSSPAVVPRSWWATESGQA